MLRHIPFAIACLFLSAAPSLADAGVTFYVTVAKDGALMSSPVVTPEWSENAVIELGNEVRLELLALPPSESTSLVTARIFLVEEDRLELAHEFESEMNLSATPSFQYSSSDRRYRVEIKPRLTQTPDTQTPD